MTLDRPALRAALRARHPWVVDPRLDDLGIGPAAVEAGECSGCGAEARLVTTCGPGGAGGTGPRSPGPTALGRRCAADVGRDAWCEGHAAEADAALAALAALPPEADDVARLWWVATGEVRIDPDAAAALRRRALPPG